MITLDQETCGLHGFTVLLQYAVDDGEVVLFSPWNERVDTTLELLEFIIYHEGGLLGFNWSFDWFHICKLYTTWSLLPRDAYPIDIIPLVLEAEKKARDGPCIKPVSVLDLMLWARKGPYQNLMGRDPIKIKNVPIQLAPLLADELNRRIPFRDIFFAKRKKMKKGQYWNIREIKERPDFAHLELKFAPAGGLKPIAVDLGIAKKNTLKFKDIDIDEKLKPRELAYAPYALALGPKGEGGWPDYIKYHNDHWAFNKLAREYATNDINYPRAALKHPMFKDAHFDDVDSTLSCLAAAARWKGYAVNLKGIKALKRKAIEDEQLAPQNRTQVISWISEVLSEDERTVLEDEHGNLTTKKVVLEEVAKTLKVDVKCQCGSKCENCEDGYVKCGCLEGCVKCQQTGRKLVPHPAAERAKLVLKSRRGTKRRELCEKLETADRLHASINIIGTRSGRKSGGSTSEDKGGKKSGSINPQGIQRLALIRCQFPLAYNSHWSAICGLVQDEDEEILVGGDADSFELTISAAYYKDPQFIKDLTDPEVGRDGKLTGRKQKIYAVVGTVFWPGNTYWQIMDTAQQEPDLYTSSKSGLLALSYFGNAYTLRTRLGVDEEHGDKAFKAFQARYPVISKEQRKFFDDYCPMKQPKGIGTQVIWSDPKEYVESMFGFKRFFTLENQICKAMFDLAEAPPKAWRDLKIKVIRRDREQTVSGAVQSALFGCAFGLQGNNMRAAGNHKIQATGAELIKRLEAEIWAIQPAGVHDWLVRPMNNHDELMVPCKRSVEARVQRVVENFITEARKTIPLFNIKWKRQHNWGAK